MIYTILQFSNSWQQLLDVLKSWRVFPLPPILFGRFVADELFKHIVNAFYLYLAVDDYPTIHSSGTRVSALNLTPILTTLQSSVW